VTIWVVISAASVSRELTEAVDSGDIASSVRLSHALNGFIDKLKNFCQHNGGSLVLGLYERCILNLPVTAAEQIPMLVQEYSSDLKGKLCVGIGMNAHEAAAAAKLSAATDQIEMYDPAKAKSYQDMMKSISAQPNIFDPQIPDTDDKQKLMPIEGNEEAKTYMKDKKKQQPILSPDAATSSKLNSSLLQTTMKELGFNPQPMQSQSMQAAPPRDLLETLNGSRVPGYNPPNEKEDDQKSKTSSAEKTMEAQVDDAEKNAEETNQKLARLLAQVRTQIPAIMQLHDKNPAAFKQAMNVVNKLVTLASKRHKVSKNQDDYVDALEKALRRRTTGYVAPTGGRSHHVYPVGTRIGRRKKVLVNGKAVWRSVASGQVKDQAGSAVSVISSNAKPKNE
jgi:hypothetical protein